MTGAAQALDALVFSVRSDRLSLVGGRGRGAGWSGVVDVDLANEPMVARARARGVPVQMGGADAVRIVGQYSATNAVLVPVGADHLVVFGGLSEAPDPRR